MSRRAVRAIGAGRYDEAIALYESEIERDPGNLEAVAMLAQCHEWQGDWPTALQYADLYLSTKPDDFSVLLIAARCSVEQGSDEQTYHYVCRAIDAPEPPQFVLPRWLRWLLKPLEIVPRFRNAGGRMETSLRRLAKRTTAQREWASAYKQWYEGKHRGERPTFH